MKIINVHWERNDLHAGDCAIAATFRSSLPGKFDIRIGYEYFNTNYTTPEAAKEAIEVKLGMRDGPVGDRN